MSSFQRAFSLVDLEASYKVRTSSCCKVCTATLRTSLLGPSRSSDSRFGVARCIKGKMKEFALLPDSPANECVTTGDESGV